MPDFFDRLLARAAAPDSALARAAEVALVAPRVPTLFERSGPADAPPPLTESLPLTGPAGPDPDPLGPTSAPPDPWPPPALTAPPTPGPPSPAPLPPRSQPASAPAAEPPQTIHHPVPVPVTTPTQVPAPAVSGGPDSATGVPRAPVVPGSPPEPRLVTPRPAALLVAPAVRPGTDATPRRDSTRAAERTVHVRIGRIEVTAPHQAPDPPAARRRGPALTLSRYLDRDAGGDPGEVHP